VLTHLSVRDLAVIREVRLELGPGLNVLSGETGAGKSLLIQALDLVLGGRGDSDAVRAGAEEAVVEALFDLTEAPEARVRLVAAGFDDDEHLRIRRVVSKAGRSRVWIGGSPATVALLRTVAAGLVDLTAQHDHVGLLRGNGGLDAVDAHARHGELREEAEIAWGTLSEARAERARLAEAALDRTARVDYLRFQLDEIDALGLEPGELERLGVARERLQHAARLSAAAIGAEASLYSAEGSAYDRLNAAAVDLSELARIDPELAPIRDGLETARALVEDAGYTLSRYASGIEAEPGRLDDIEDRLAALERVLRKHGATNVAEAMERQDAMAAELEELDAAEDRLAALDARIEAAGAEVERIAAALSRGRRRAAIDLSAAVQEGVRRLGMATAIFEVRVEPAAPGPTGSDTVALLLGPNPGEEALPLGRIASGGELSRTLLALKAALAAGDRVPVQVFDEIDAGVGGATGEVVGARLADLALRHQVLVVTHLAQVAAYAGKHLRVEKHELEGRSETRVVELDAAEREEEIACMLAGRSVTAQARGLAKELLSRASAAQA
jgi:DNA repair protein RecN (Recombination protein N)